MLLPSFLAPTITPSITGSAADDTLPLKAAFCAVVGVARNAAAKAVPAKSKNFALRIFASPRNVVRSVSSLLPGCYWQVRRGPCGLSDVLRLPPRYRGVTVDCGK